MNVDLVIKRLTVPLILLAMCMFALSYTNLDTPQTAEQVAHAFDSFWESMFLWNAPYLAVSLLGCVAMARLLYLRFNPPEVAPATRAYLMHWLALAGLALVVAYYALLLFCVLFLSKKVESPGG